MKVRGGVRNFSVAPANGVLEGARGFDPVVMAQAFAGIVSGHGTYGPGYGERLLVHRIIVVAIADLESLDDRDSAAAYLASPTCVQHLEWIDLDPDVWMPALRRIVARTHVRRCARYHGLEPGATVCLKCRAIDRDNRRAQRAKGPREQPRRSAVGCAAALALALLLLALPARAVTLVEPVATEPCDRNGGVYGCVVVLRGQATWFRPASLCGGGRHVLPDLALDGVRANDLPLDVSAACYGPGGWGPSWRGTLAVVPVEAP